MALSMAGGPGSGVYSVKPQDGNRLPTWKSAAVGYLLARIARQRPPDNVQHWLFSSHSTLPTHAHTHKMLLGSYSSSISDAPALALPLSL